jgi:hypothetical protein
MTAVESDVAHAVDNALLTVHEAVAAGATPSWALQLHTNLEPTINGDVLLSTGTRMAATPTSVAALLFASLASSGIDARTCNDPSRPVASTAYCGETNAEGLATNGAADSCTAFAKASSGTFLHLEQNSGRLTDVDGWSNQVATAVAASIPTR